MGNLANLSNDVTAAHRSLLFNTASLNSAATDFITLVKKIEERIKELEEKEEELQRREEEVQHKSKELEEWEKELKEKEQLFLEQEEIWRHIQSEVNSSPDQSLIQEDNSLASVKQISNVKDPNVNKFSELSIGSNIPTNISMPFSPLPTMTPSPPPTLPVVPAPIRQWLPKRTFKLLYKATREISMEASINLFKLAFLVPSPYCPLPSRDGFGKEDFHNLCDYKGASINIIESDRGYLFGGYTPISWGSTFGRDIIHPDFFLFTLSNPHNIPPTQYKLRTPLDKKAHASGNLWHVAFGNADLFVADKDAHLQTNSYSRFGEKDCSYIDTTGKGPSTFTGARFFRVKEVEVYLVI